MTKYKVSGEEIRNLAKKLVLEFMKEIPSCQEDQEGMTLAQIFRESGLDWGEYQNATSTNQQYWVVALMRELEQEKKVERILESKKWRLHVN